jgi:drug/metabolite transporter (DMT)-like permease
VVGHPIARYLLTLSESGLAFLLVLTAAALHVTWNVMVKRSEEPLVFMWMLDLIPAAILWPMLFVAPPDPARWHVIIASGAVHAVANVAIAEAYVRADFSVAYPVARGLSALLGALTGTLLLGERLGWLGFVGVALTALGVAWIGLAAPTTSGRPPGIAWAVTMGGLIATYSLVDKVAVTGMNPVAFAAAFLVCDTVLLAPYVLMRRGPTRVVEVLRHQPGVMLGAAVVSLVAYVLILTALRLSQLSYVAPLRELSVVGAAVIGWRLLGEPQGLPRVVGAAIATLGLVLLGVAMAAS